jgi:hypothetical protein
MLSIAVTTLALRKVQMQTMTLTRSVSESIANSLFN